MAVPQESVASAAESTIALALGFAAAHPQVMLPCPRCAASVKAANLQSHLSKVHPGPLPENRGPLRITGVDKRIFYVFIGLIIAWVVAVTVANVLKVPLTTPTLVLLGVSTLVCFGLPTAAALGVFKAQLELDGEQLRLRWLLGLASRAVGFPAELETGTAIDTEMKHPGLSAVDGAAKDVECGSYLRLSSGGRAITLVAKKTPGLGQRWAPAGWTRGKDRRRWDITVPRLALIALEYQLAARGQLTLRET